jgi:hypothetical protein
MNRYHRNAFRLCHEGTLDTITKATRFRLASEWSCPRMIWVNWKPCYAENCEGRKRATVSEGPSQPINREISIGT